MVFEVLRQVNEAIGFEQSILSKNQDYKSFLHVTVKSCGSTFWSLDAHGGRKLKTHTHLHETTTITFAAQCTQTFPSTYKSNLN